MRTVLVLLLLLVPLAAATEIPSSYRVVAVRETDGATFLAFAWVPRGSDCVRLWGAAVRGGEAFDICVPADAQQSESDAPRGRVVLDTWQGADVAFAGAWLDSAEVREVASGGGTIGAYRVHVFLHT